jgi:8-hydroxy-5-deazaflavin:NADPH oxidoreductase
MKIAVLGTGTVGQSITNRLIGLGHEVKMGTRNVTESKARTKGDAWGNPGFTDWLTNNPSIDLVTFEEAAKGREIIFNTTAGVGAIEALTLAGESNLNGKIIIDISNPLDFSKGQPATLFSVNTTSLGEEIQAKFPQAKVVKTLNTMWNGLMVNPKMIGNGDHNVFMSGNDAEAKEKVKEILISFDWTPSNILDLGDITTARGTEMYLPLWLRIWGATQNGAFNIKIVS